MPDRCLPIDGMRELDQDRMIVLSLKPGFAEAILAGDKTVELRRIAPRIVVPTQGTAVRGDPSAGARGHVRRDKRQVGRPRKPVAEARLEDRAAPPRVPAALKGRRCWCGTDAGTSATVQPGIPLDDLRP